MAAIRCERNPTSEFCERTRKGVKKHCIHAARLDWRFRLGTSPIINVSMLCNGLLSRTCVLQVASVLSIGLCAKTFAHGPRPESRKSKFACWFPGSESKSLSTAAVTSAKGAQSPRVSFMICGLSVRYHRSRLLESIGLVFVHVHFFRIRTTIASVGGCAASSTSVNNNAYTARPHTLSPTRFT